MRNCVHRTEENTILHAAMQMIIDWDYDYLVDYLASNLGYWR